MDGMLERQFSPPPRLLLDGRLKVRAVNDCLRRICNLGAGVWRGVSVEEWVNADSALLTRIRAGISRRSPSWIEVITLRLPGGGAVMTMLKLMPLRGRRRSGLLVTVIAAVGPNGHRQCVPARRGYWPGACA